MTKVKVTVGYGMSVDKGAGVHKVEIVERSYYGDREKNSRSQNLEGSVNGKFTLQNTIEIMADAYAYDHASVIRYVEDLGARWEVTNVAEERPRLILRLGGPYNGKTPGSPGNS